VQLLASLGWSTGSTLVSSADIESRHDWLGGSGSPWKKRNAPVESTDAAAVQAADRVVLGVAGASTAGLALAAPHVAEVRRCRILDLELRVGAVVWRRDARSVFPVAIRPRSFWTLGLSRARVAGECLASRATGGSGSPRLATDQLRVAQVPVSSACASAPRHARGTPRSRFAPTNRAPGSAPVSDTHQNFRSRLSRRHWFLWPLMELIRTRLAAPKLPITGPMPYRAGPKRTPAAPLPQGPRLTPRCAKRLCQLL
jgi:hypothetical protein